MADTRITLNLKTWKALNNKLWVELEIYQILLEFEESGSFELESSYGYTIASESSYGYTIASESSYGYTMASLINNPNPNPN